MVFARLIIIVFVECASVFLDFLVKVKLDLNRMVKIIIIIVIVIIVISYHIISYPLKKCMACFHGSTFEEQNLEKNGVKC